MIIPVLNAFHEFWVLILLFLIISILYSSVGFGGGSSYLAILALSGILFTQIRSTALLCNIVVVSSNVFLFYRAKQYEWKKVIPLVLLSAPFAFLGGYIKLSQQFFFILLGIILLFASLSMWFSNKFIDEIEGKKKSSFLENSLVGGLIGFLSGLVGIGGGIFLAPFLHLSFWDTPKKIAAISSFFILVNSLSGLAGQVMNPEFTINYQLTLILLATVFFGSIIGNILRNKFLSPILLKKMTAILIAFVSIRILFKYLF